MSGHRQIDRICAVIVVLALLITVAFMFGESWGLQMSASGIGYEDRLFDTSRVHTIDIVIDDWESFIESAESEEYDFRSVVSVGVG
ncbi:MAG: hypothetical protein LUF30_08150 [Lachnospiraceae bacterium]|nr:hypothetical protein [Lachnospiraceae bacterium]